MTYTVEVKRITKSVAKEMFPVWVAKQNISIKTKKESSYWWTSFVEELVQKELVSTTVAASWSNPFYTFRFAPMKGENIQ